MGNPFFEHPILNSPYECPSRHWELDKQGLPTQKIIERNPVSVHLFERNPVSVHLFGQE